MSIEELKRLEQDAKEKVKVRDMLKAAGPDPVKLAQFAASMGYAVSADDINQYVQAKKAAMSEKELNQVAGGRGDIGTEQTTMVVISSDLGQTDNSTQAVVQNLQTTQVV